MAEKTTMPKGWKETTLGDVAEIIGGQSPEGKYYNETNNGLPFYQGKTEFTEMYIGKPKVWTTEKTKIAEAGDILISVRAPVGPLNIATERICIGRGLASIRANKIWQMFLFYDLKSIQSKIRGKSGTVFDSITKQEIEKIKILLPPLPEQRAIAAVLSSFDNKIELLREQNKTLEATAQLIFKEWFVKFNFPNASGKMVNSELGKIPEGWRVGKYSENS